MRTSEVNSGKPAVSVVVPAYNYGHLLGETLENLLQQTESNWECIVVDDGSTDDTADLARQWVEKDKRFRYVYQKNPGLSAARNTGIQAAKGDFIQLLDADDLLVPTKFSSQLNAFRAVPHADIVYGEVRYFLSDKPDAHFMTLDCRQEPWMPGSGSGNQFQLICDLLRVNLYAVNCPLIKKSVFERIGWFDTTLRSVEDWDYWCRSASGAIYFHFLPTPVAFALVRTHEGSMSRNKRTMWEAARKVRYKIMRLIQTHPDRADAAKWLEINRIQTASLARQLAGLHKQEGRKWSYLKSLFEFARLRGEYRFFIKETLQLLGKK